MIECPNCTIENPPGRAYCQVCGERLPSPYADAGGEGAPPRDQTLPESDRFAPRTDTSNNVPEPPLADHLPSWLQGTEIYEEDAAALAVEWDEDLDFSNLPDWPIPGIGAPTRDSAATWEDESPETVRPAATGQGLLSGVAGPIPVEAAVESTPAASRVPLLPGLAVATDEATNLFARIAGGVVVPRPTRRGRVGTGWVRGIQLMLLLSILIPLLIEANLFGSAPLPAAAAAFQAEMESLPAGESLLVAIEYDGGMIDAVEPAAALAFEQVALDGAARPLLIATSSAQGLGLAARLQPGATSAGLEWQELGYYPGEESGPRGALADAARAATPPGLLLVIGGESRDVQRWLEQSRMADPTLPVIAIVPALAEPVLTPYLDSGQLRGLLAGPAATSALATATGSAAGPRVDALALGLLFAITVIAGGAILQGRRQEESPA